MRRIPASFRVASPLALLWVFGAACAAPTPRVAASHERVGGRSYVLAGAAVRIQLAAPRDLWLLPDGARTWPSTRASGGAAPRGRIAADSIPVRSVREVLGRVRAQRADTFLVQVTQVRQLAGAPAASGWKAGRVDVMLVLNVGDRVQVLTREPELLTVGLFAAVITAGWWAVRIMFPRS